MRHPILTALLALTMVGSGTVAAAQIVRVPPILRGPPRGQPPPPPTIEMMQAAMVANSGSDVVYFAGQGHGLDSAAQATLIAQARWLRANPAVRARIEGHADERTPRDHALALGERRADAVRNFLVLQGVPSWQLSITSWGKERSAVGGTSDMALALNRRAKTVLMR